VRIATDLPHPIEVLEKNVWIPLERGDRLAARIWLPKGAERNPVPALLEYLPYRKRDMTRPGDEPKHAWFAGHGYASLRVDMAGAGDSFGVMRDEYARQELEDGKEVIAWIARQPWCTGKVGMFGISWGGFNSLQVAALRPPALEAIVTSCSTDDRYADDMHYMGGCLLNDNLDWGTTFFSILPLPGDPEIMGKGWRRNWMRRLENVPCPVELWMKHQRRDAYWRHGSVCEDWSAIQCPVFAVGGWLDGYSNAIFRLLANLEVPRLGLVGPHAHQWGYSERAPGPAIGFLQEMLRWWDHWLKGEDTGIMKEPMLRAYLQDDVPAKPWYAHCPGEWIGEASWPSRRIRTATLRLNPEGLGATRGKDVPRIATTPQTLGLAGGEWCPYGTGGDGPEFPGDQRFDDGASITFDSDPLAEDLDILGAPVVTLDLAVDKPLAFVAVRLNDVKPDGSVARATYGVLNLTHREGHDRVKPMKPGRRETVRVRLNDTAYRFRAGHRLRVAVSTTYWPLVWPSPEPVTLTLHTGTSSLALPVRPAGGPKVAPFAEPETAPPMPSAPVRVDPPRNTVTRDVLTGRVEVLAERGGGVYRILEHGMEFGRNTRERMAITEGDPLSAETEMTVTSHMKRGDFQVDVRATTRLRATKETFLLTADLDVYEGKERILARTWSVPIARDGV
jgi:hypothetical protein